MGPSQPRICHYAFIPSPHSTAYIAINTTRSHKVSKCLMWIDILPHISDFYSKSSCCVLQPPSVSHTFTLKLLEFQSIEPGIQTWIRTVVLFSDPFNTCIPSYLAWINASLGFKVSYFQAMTSFSFCQSYTGTRPSQTIFTQVSGLLNRHPNHGRVPLLCESAFLYG